MMLPVVDVAVNIVRAPDGRVLMAERTRRQTGAGYWELPGGKIDAGETPSQAAARELDEEIGIQAHRLRRWISYEHAFRTKRIRLHVFQVEGYAGVAHGREGQRLAWVDPASPTVAPVLPSIERVVAALALPPVGYNVRLNDHGGVAGLRAHVQQIVAARPVLLLLDGAGLPPEQRVVFARSVGLLAQRHGASALLVGSAIDAQRAGLGGILSNVADLRAHPVPAQGKLWAVRCSSETELAHANAHGADVIIAAPLLPTPTHAAAPLGWAGLQRLAAISTVPVFASGGIAPALLDQALAQARVAGAAGIVLD